MCWITPMAAETNHIDFAGWKNRWKGFEMLTEHEEKAIQDLFIFMISIVSLLSEGEFVILQWHMICCHRKLDSWYRLTMDLSAIKDGLKSVQVAIVRIILFLAYTCVCVFVCHFYPTYTGQFNQSCLYLKKSFDWMRRQRRERKNESTRRKEKRKGERKRKTYASFLVQCIGLRQEKQL